MTNRFLKHLTEHQLQSQSPVLIGTSGGRDSMVLCHLYLEAQIPFAIAHCNFNLRGEESDGDEAFVKQWARKHQLTIHRKRFQTKAYAESNGISIQMAARELRLNWFEELCVENEYEFYATAHHSDDAIETYFINQIRGTGISGLHGILPKQGRLIHPLLFMGRSEITEYAQSKNIDWREDSSNKNNKYLRNKVRNELMPVLKKINPQIDSIIQENINRFRATEDLYFQKIKEIQGDLLKHKNGAVYIDLSKIQSTKQPSLIIYEILKKFEFNYHQIDQLLNSKEGISGASLESKNHVLLRNRNELILQEKRPPSNEVWRIEKAASSVNQPIFLNFEYLETFSIKKEEKYGQFDLSKLRFPLLLRQWRHGDSFFPLGMNGKRKLLSDYFIDEKMSIFEKSNCWLLCSGNEIVWVVGRRADDRFKITEDTKQILQVEWLQ